MNVHAGHNSYTPTVSLDFDLHEKQWHALMSSATELFYGGAAGGGKSHLMRAAAIGWALLVPGVQIYLFRRIRDDLIKNHVEGPMGFRALLAPLEAAGTCRIVEDQIRFYNGPNGKVGSKIYLCHVKDDKDVYKYQGHEIHVLLIDELTHFTEMMYRFLRNRVRMTNLNPPSGFEGLFPRILASGNPGGIGHQWVKTTFVDPGDWSIYKASESEGGMMRQFIPARLEDNPTILEEDPNYESRMAGLGSEALVRAMRWGDWDIIEGAFFETLTMRTHGLEPFKIPRSWTRFRSGDWGSAKPFSFGWWAIVPDPYTTHCGKVLPRGAIVRYREYYGVAHTKEGRVVPDKGLKMTAEAVSKNMAKLEAADPPIKGRSVLDPACFASDGGPSIASRINNKANGIFFHRADNKRVAGRGAFGGWSMMNTRIIGANGVPMLYVFKTCRDWWRTVPALQHDTSNPEDVDTDMEDHAGDETRYACMSRPWLPRKLKKDPALADTGYRTRRKDRKREHGPRNVSLV